MNTVSGRTEFTLHTTLPVREVVRIAQEVLDSYGHVPGVSNAYVREISSTELELGLNLASDSFAEAEARMTAITSSISDALRGHQAKLEQGLTELVSA